MLDAMGSDMQMMGMHAGTRMRCLMDIHAGMMRK